MKEYSVRYLSMKTLTSVCENGKTVKYTYEEAVEKAKELNARADVSYCKIYKGRTLIETVEKPVEETVETEMKKYYFISEIRGIVGEHSGNIRGAKTKAQKFAEQFDEEITILVRSNKEIDCGKNIPANEVCRVCNADGDVLAVCSTYGNAFAWCAENGIEGEIGEYEPYIEVGTYSENGNFEVEDYSSIDTGDGMWNIINDYCDYVDTVCPEATTETEQTEVEETAETETEETIKTTAERQKDEVIIMTNKEMQTAVENWYMNRKPSSPYFTMNGEKYAVLPRYGTSSNEFDVFKIKTFTIGKGTYHYPYYDPETREPIDRIAVVTIPDELVAKKEAQVAEEENNNTLFEDFFQISLNKGGRGNNNE